MKIITMFLSLIILIVSCKNETGLINAPVLIGETDGVLASIGFNDLQDFISKVDSNSRLLKIVSSDISVSGTSHLWEYEFVSEEGLKLYKIKYEILGDCISIGIDTTENNSIGNAPVSENWIDSDFALEIAETNGGESFRNENSETVISIVLSEGVVNDPFPVWDVMYLTPNKGLILRIRALNGQMHQTIHRI